MLVQKGVQPIFWTTLVSTPCHGGNKNSTFFTSSPRCVVCPSLDLLEGILDVVSGSTKGMDGAKKISLFCRRVKASLKLYFNLKTNFKLKQPNGK